jgi:hypothetical protein
MRITRNHLFSLLSEACEIEHSLACAYLYAAFSIKQGSKCKLDWRKQQLTRRWAGQIYFVASQEMLHLAQAWNLLAAIGGTPYFMRPPTPQPKGYWPLPAALTFRRFSLATVERFAQWEAPVESKLRSQFRRWEHETTDPELPFRSVGQLYDLIAEGIESIPQADLFLGDPQLQIGTELADFPDLVCVVDRSSAIEAIRRVQHQGEGIKTDRDDSHFGIFYEMHVELQAILREDPSFDPAFPALDNPTTRARHGANLVTDAATRDVIAIFNDLYVLAMRLLGWVFGPGAPDHKLTKAFARAGIGMMPVILKPMGEILARLPSGDGQHTAGAPFALQRHVPLPDKSAVAHRLVSERIAEIAERTELLLQRPELREQLGWLSTQVAWLSRQVDAALEGESR